jgi:2-furoate---CoA ligase
MRLDTLLDLAAERDPRATAIVDGERRYSYAEWHARVQRAADGLRRLGVRRGDRVVLCLRNREELATLHLACQRLGAITTPLNFRLASGEIAYCVGDAAPCVVVYEPDTAATILAGRSAWGARPLLVAVDDAPGDAVAFDALLDAGGAGPSAAAVPAPATRAPAGADALAPGDSAAAAPFSAADRAAAVPFAPRDRAIAAPLPPGDRDDAVPGPVTNDANGGPADDRLPGLILYTSGTTGRPKGVPRSQRAEYAAALAHVAQNSYTPGESTLGLMPLYHTMGMRSLLAMLLLNGRYVAVREFDPAAALAIIAAERLTALYLVPTAYYALLQDPAATTADLSSVRKLGYAGASMTTTLEAECRRRFAPEVFVNHYGSTEVYTFTVNRDLVAKPGCAGRPGIHARMRVVAPDPERQGSAEDMLPDGEVGELITSLASDEAFAGYWRRPDADARGLRDGWYFTGDLGYRDADGDYWVTGRVDDMIITGGENVYPIEVEDVLARHPAVAEVAVVGLPDEKWGQAVTAFVVPRQPSLSAADLDAHCRASDDLAAFKRPKRVVFVRALPKSPVGKLLRRLLVAGEYDTV